MVRGFFKSAGTFIDLAALQTVCKVRCEQEVIDPDPAIMFKCLAKVIPESKLSWQSRMQRAEGICVTELQHLPILSTWFGLKKSILDPGGRLMAIDVLGDDVEVTANQCRRFFL